MSTQCNQCPRNYFQFSSTSSSFTKNPNPNLTVFLARSLSSFFSMIKQTFFLCFFFPRHCKHCNGWDCLLLLHLATATALWFGDSVVVRIFVGGSAVRIFAGDGDWARVGLCRIWVRKSEIGLAEEGLIFRWRWGKIRRM